MGTKQQIDMKEDLELDQKQPELTCGIVMPIAAMGEYSANHWADVYAIIKEAVGKTGYTAKLVSESDDSTVIPKSIVQNLYDDDIVICDVSGKNPNVMFELGMRLAFDKPVVLIKDDITGYSFDTSTIEHLTYPRDLRYSAIQNFKELLANKLLATYETSQKKEYRSFLSNFASIKIAHLEHTTVGEAEALEKILKKLDTIENRMSIVENSKIGITSNSNFGSSTINGAVTSLAKYVLYDAPMKNLSASSLAGLKKKLKEIFPDAEAEVYFHPTSNEAYLKISSYKNTLPLSLTIFQKEIKPYIEQFC